VLTYAIANRLLLDDTPPDADAPALAALVGASARNVRALGPGAGLPVHPFFGADAESLRPKESRFHVHDDGFDLHAGLSVRATRRGVLERVLRYCLRPALSYQRIERLSDGRVRLALKTPWRDGTTHLFFEPLEFIGRLTALIPRPHKNLVIYHGALAPRSKWRKRVVAYRRPALPATEASPPVTPPPRSARHKNYAWAVVMRRAFELDVLACPACAGRPQLVACVTKPAAIRAILDHLALPSTATPPQPARAPPWERTVDGAESPYDMYDRYDAIDEDPDSAA
jgi:hypothetical protein